MSVKGKLIGLGMMPQLAQNVVGTVANNLTALGSSSQSAAYQMSTDDWQIFTTVSSNTGCIFSPGVTSASSPYQAGDEMTITNHGLQTLSVYPPTGGKIANGSLNAAFTIASTKTGFFMCIDGTNWAASVSA